MNPKNTHFFSRGILFFLTAWLCLFCSGCTAGQTSSAGEDGITVVTTNYFLYDTAKKLVRPEDRVILLISPGTESHDFELTLSDMALLESCDLFAYIGGEGEAWVYSALETFSQSGIEIPAFCAMDAVDAAGGLLTEAHDHEHSEQDDHSHEDSHRYDGMDDHVWLSIPNAITVLGEMHTALVNSTEAQSTELPTEYIEKLRALDEKLRVLTDSVPAPEILVADRFPFAYLTAEYGIAYTAAFDGCTSDTEPSLETVHLLIEKTKALGQGTVLVTELSDGQTARSVCAQVPGTAIAELHSCHNVTAGDFEAGVTYLDLMNRNYTVLEKLWKS